MRHKIKNSRLVTTSTCCVVQRNLHTAAHAISWQGHQFCKKTSLHLKSQISSTFSDIFINASYSPGLRSLHWVNNTVVKFFEEFIVTQQANKCIQFVEYESSLWGSQKYTTEPLLQTHFSTPLLNEVHLNFTQLSRPMPSNLLLRFRSSDQNRTKH